MEHRIETASKQQTPLPILNALQTSDEINSALLPCCIACCWKGVLFLEFEYRLVLPFLFLLCLTKCLGGPMADIMLESASFACPKATPARSIHRLTAILQVCPPSFRPPFSSFVCCRCRARPCCSVMHQSSRSTDSCGVR